jgi:hypothetical protein
VNLNQIKQHPYYPFRDFDGNDLSFLLLELYWAELLRWTLRAAPGAQATVSLPKPICPAERDGNPILHVVDRSLPLPRTLRVIQRFNTENLPALDLDTFSPVGFTGDAYVPFVPGLTYGAVDSDGSSPIEELVISSDISSACERLFELFVHKWYVERVTPQAMQQSLDAYWKAVEENLIEGR